MLCVPRQIAELLKLPLQEVIEDFNSICPGNWQQRGVCPAEIRTFCMWRNAPMFYVDSRGRLLDCFQPAEKEEKAVAFSPATSGPRTYAGRERSYWPRATAPRSPCADCASGPHCGCECPVRQTA